ncbi:MAG TPA: aminotransferase class IV [Vicinamibacterales bacterium]|nr:aminotransferase class IV [Vicinamibacterales bacterium]
MDSAAPRPGVSFSLLETMRLEHGRVERLERHVARMAEAARYFEYQWNEAAVREVVNSVAGEHPGGCWRVRVLLSANGSPTIECTPLVQDAHRWRVDFALEPVDPQDPFILHKTTHRIVYEAARRSKSEVDDVLLWNRRGEVTESTIANVVAEIDGLRYTPPVRCGLLAGTFRAEQLEAGTIYEHALTKSDVVSASRVWLINSVRGWVDAEFVGDAK